MRSLISTRAIGLLYLCLVTQASWAQTSCIENGGNELCLPLLIGEKWCYTDTWNAYKATPSIHFGYGSYGQCFQSIDETLAAVKAQNPGIEYTGASTAVSDVRWVNGQVVGQAQTFDIKDNVDVVVSWRKVFLCPPGTYGRFVDPLASNSGYPTFRYYCSVSEFPPNAGGCPLGNPIHPATGRKTEAHTDFVDGSNPGLLRFSRHYDSLGGTRLSHQFIGRKWTSSASVTLIVAPAGYGASTTLQRADGTLEGFKASPTGLVPIGDARGRLVQHVDTSGLTTAWTYYGADDRIFRFSAAGLLLAEGTPDGHSLTYSYADGTTSNPLQCRVAKPATGRLWCVSDELGRKLDFEYDGGDRLIRLTDPAGQVIRYGYDEVGYFRAQNGVASDVLTSVTYPDGAKRYYHYNESQNVYVNLSDVSLLTGVSDEVSPGVVVRYATFTYDSLRRATAYYSRIRYRQLHAAVSEQSRQELGRSSRHQPNGDVLGRRTCMAADCLLAAGRRRMRARLLGNHV